MLLCNGCLKEKIVVDVVDTRIVRLVRHEQDVLGRLTLEITDLVKRQDLGWLDCHAFRVALFINRIELASAFKYAVHVRLVQLANDDIREAVVIVLHELPELELCVHLPLLQHLIANPVRSKDGDVRTEVCPVVLGLHSGKMKQLVEELRVILQA
jgi:hypothetical protein